MSGGVDAESLQQAVRDHYAEAARGVTNDEPGIGAGCHPAADLDGLPERAVAASIGCANPVAVADLAEGEVVLDLGSGGGIDVLLSARRVGSGGKAYGLDMTDEMLDLARRNQACLSTGDICCDIRHWASPVRMGGRVAEAFRVLRPGGRLALADVVAERAPEPGQDLDAAAWVACVSGALTEARYVASLEAAGFTAVSIRRSHTVSEGFTSVVVRASKP